MNVIEFIRISLIYRLVLQGLDLIRRQFPSKVILVQVELGYPTTMSYYNHHNATSHPLIMHAVPRISITGQYGLGDGERIKVEILVSNFSFLYNLNLKPSVRQALKMRMIQATTSSALLCQRASLAVQRLEPA
jgi:hypothetical protein